MRILLTANACYDPPRGGSTRGNLAWLAHLASRGHTCRVIASNDGEDLESNWSGVAIRGVKDLSFRAAVLAEEIRAFQPDWVLVSSEDLSHVLLREAAAAAPGRILYIAHTPQFFPFGKESWNPEMSAAAIVKQARRVVAIGEHMAGYIAESLGRAATVIHPPIYGAPPYRKFGRFGSGFVLMINPCTVKGLPIFLDLARRFPHIEFAALNGWGTTAADRTALAKTPNTTLLANVPDIEDVLAEARLLLMPSLWYEGFGLIAMEAMLRGLPVVASDSGGLREAKGGTGYTIPVKPIVQFERSFDEKHMPVAVAPPQDLAPWMRALESLLTDELAYWEEAERSRTVALQFVSALDAAEFERMLESLPREPVHLDRRAALARLTSAQRVALAARLKLKQGS